MDRNNKIDTNQQTVFRFQEFPVYQAARTFRAELKQYTKRTFPKEEQFALTSQIWRALDSILLNIAEGSERYSDLEFSRFLNTAVTSLSEVVAGLDAALDDGYLNQENYQRFRQSAEGIYRQLRAFSTKVRRSA